jgi:acetyltransferase-like isoleucine patch superfamily enzyme
MTKNFKIYKKVHLGKNCQIQQGVIIGLPPLGKKDGELETFIGDNAILRSNTVIYAGVRVGNNCQTGHNVVIREDNKIEENFNIWSNSVLSPRNIIGSNVKIHCGCFIEASTIEDDVFLGPNVVITDDLHPVCPRWKECVGGAVIRKGASVGGNVTILPGVEIGQKSLIGAGSVVTKNLEKNSVAIGNPAKQIKKIKDLVCLRKFYSIPYEWRNNENQFS